jgi:hypothetical protein
MTRTSDFILQIPASNFDAPNQPRHFNFPKRCFGKDKVRFRQFQPQWFEKFKWIHYSEDEDKVYCHPCSVAYKRGMITSGTNCRFSKIINETRKGRVHYF